MPEGTFVEPKSTNWPKIILATIFGLALLCAATYAGYWYGTESVKVKSQISKPTTVAQPTPKPTQSVEVKDWKTYQSSKMGFSIKCPPDLKVFLDAPVQDVTTRADYFLATLSTEQKVEPEEGIKEELMFIEIGSWKGFTPAYEEGATFQDFIDREVAFFKSRWDPQLKTEDFILDNNPAIKTSHIKSPILDSSYKQVVIVVYTEKDEYMYEIACWVDLERQNIYLPIFNQILSTFEFLD